MKRMNELRAIDGSKNVGKQTRCLQVQYIKQSSTMQVTILFNTFNDNIDKIFISFKHFYNAFGQVNGTVLRNILSLMEFFDIKSSVVKYALVSKNCRLYNVEDLNANV